MKAARLELDFVADALPLQRRLGLALLWSGSIALLGCALVWGEAWSAQARQTRALAALESAQAKAIRGPEQSPADPNEVARERVAMRIARVLQIPWSDLLITIESARHSAVALLALEPSTHDGSLRLTAEARDPKAMLEYLQALQADTRLSQVILVSHQVQTQVAGSPVRFQIRSAWGSMP